MTDIMGIKFGQTGFWGLLWFIWLFVGSLFYGYYEDSFITSDGEEPHT